MEVDPSITLAPVSNLLVLVCSVIVNDQMEVQLSRRLFLHGLQEGQEFLKRVDTDLE